MFAKLFAESGLSLDRLRALVEVGAAGGIVRAVGDDPVRQSQYSRQLKELEDFFRVKLTERHGKGIRLSPHGRELARISRFFLLGLSNFQRGCLAEEQAYRIGASSTCAGCLLLPALSCPDACSRDARFMLEVTTDAESEQRLHELTLDFAVVTAAAISRPLQLEKIRAWRLDLWVPKSLAKTRRQAEAKARDGDLRLAVAERELPSVAAEAVASFHPGLVCGSFLEARHALHPQGPAVLLPDFLRPLGSPEDYWKIHVPGIDARGFHYHLAWNPRLLRLNPHAIRQRDLLLQVLTQQDSAHNDALIQTGKASPHRELTRAVLDQIWQKARRQAATSS